MQWICDGGNIFSRNAQFDVSAEMEFYIYKIPRLPLWKVTLFAHCEKRSLPVGLRELYSFSGNVFSPFWKLFKKILDSLNTDFNYFPFLVFEKKQKKIIILGLWLILRQMLISDTTWIAIIIITLR